MLAASSFSTGETVAVTVIFGLGVLLMFAFFAYAIHHVGHGARDFVAVANSGFFGLAAQILLALIIAYGLILLMESKVISSSAGLPALTGLTGFLVGKGHSTLAPLSSQEAGAILDTGESRAEPSPDDE